MSLSPLPDHVPAAFDHQLDRTCALTMEAFQLATRQEMIAAGSTMGLTTSSGAFVIATEHDQSRLVEWTVFHTRREGKSLIQILLDRLPANVDATERSILTAMASSSWGLYRIDDLRPGVGAVVTDLWRETVLPLYSRVLHNSVRLSDPVLARLFTVGDITTSAVLITKLPDGFMDGLREFQVQGFLSDADLAQGGSAQEFFVSNIVANKSAQKPTLLTAAGPRLGHGGMSGKNRNQPCPCGSGRKFKICCGRGG